MKWSHSAHVSMRRCQRQLGLGHIVASATAKDPDRREAHVLKQLQNLAAWQGSIVHAVLAAEFVDALRTGRPINAAALTAIAQDLAHRQFAFSAARRYREPGQSKRAAGRAYCALVEHERGQEISSARLGQVHTNVARCFDHLTQQAAFLDDVRAGSGHLAEPRLSFRIDGAAIVAHPDLVFFRPGGQAVVVDWKVGESQTSDYSRQLLVYALAVERCGRWSGVSAAAATLCEVNLLKNEVRQHAVTLERLEEAEDFVYRSVIELRGLVGSGRFAELDLDELDVATHPATCRYCTFAPLCLRLLDQAGRRNELEVVQGRLL